ncbi:DUF2232 domain-containing protein [Ferrovibrio xuzhouensis]|uniref:DUF2232 domain-containing protein n=1 Tax=Ferrovibrio xuzhouensis TaxID=1576914 RepID=A0ABV7VQD3_9PROT
MTRSLIFGSLAGLASALLTLTASNGLLGFVLSYLAPLPLLLAGLTHGVLAVGIAGAVGTVISGVNGLATGGVFLATFAVPAVILVRQALLARPAEEAGAGAGAVSSGALEWYPAGRLLLWLVGWAAGMFAVAVIVAAGHDGGLPGTIQPALEKVLLAFQQVSADTATRNADPAELAATLAPLLPSAIAFGWLMVMVLNGALAQGLAVMLKQNRRPSPQYRAVLLPRVLVILLAVAIAAAVLLPRGAAYVGITMATILAVPYLLQGLAVMHGLAARTAMPGFLLAAFYAVLVAGSLGGFLIALVVILGLIEEWAGFRRRLAGAGASREKD